MRRSMPGLGLAIIFVLFGGRTSFANSEAEAGLHLGPYTIGVTQTLAKILWVTSPENLAKPTLAVDQGGKVEIQTKPIPKRKETLHVGTVSGLKAGVRYQYKLTFSRDGRVVAEVPGKFFTLQREGSQSPVRFVVYGDSRGSPERHRKVAAAIAGEPDVAFLVHTGDFVGYANTWPQWKREFFDPAQELLRHTTLWPSMGNHELGGGVARSLFDLTKSYYSFDSGNVHYVVLNSELVERAADPAMLAWLEKDLLASKAAWKIVSYHRPTFDVISHRTTWGQKDVLPILEKGGVDMVISGHTHNYQRFRPIGSAGRKPIIFIVSAGGGAESYAVNPSPTLEKGHSGLHYCLVTVNGDTLEMKAKLPDGTAVDEIRLTKANGVYQKEIMDRTISTTFAREAAFLLSGFWADGPAPPEPGKSFTFLVSPHVFPEGSTVEISSAVKPLAKPGELTVGEWTVEPVTLTNWLGRDDLSHRPELEFVPLRFKAVAPKDLKPRLSGFRPALRVRLRVTYKGQTYTRDDAPVLFTSVTLKRWQEHREAAEAVRR